jgi:hypothetical protein
VTRCPDEATWLAAELGEVLVHTRVEMDAHRAQCTACSDALRRVQMLLQDVAALPPRPLSEDAFLQRVMAECAALSTEQPLASSSHKVRNLPVWIGTALSVAAALLLIFLRGDVLNKDLVQPRGGREPAHAALAGAFADILLVRQGQGLSPSGSVLEATDRLTVRSGNKAEVEAFTLAFAVDAQGEVHWLFPAYVDEATDPEAVRLKAHTPPQVAREAVELEDPAPGKLTLVTLVSPRMLRVKEVESRLASMARAELSQVFPEARVRTWISTWSAR